MDLGRPLSTPENQPLSGEGSLLLTKISLACHNVMDEKSHVFSIVHSVLQNLVHGRQFSFYIGSDNLSLEALRRNCEASEKIEASSGLLHILALIRYRTQTERYSFFFKY